jgi:transcriptional regulator with XRE-family HTH domain
MVQVAERANISRQTLGHLESGDTGTSIGVLMRVLKVLSLDKDLDAVAKDDVLGCKLQDLKLDKPRLPGTTHSNQQSHRLAAISRIRHESQS